LLQGLNDWSDDSMKGGGLLPTAAICDTVQITPDLAAKLFSPNVEENHHEYEYRDRTHSGNCDRYFNIAGTEVFKLFRGRVFDRRGHLGANAS